MKLRKTTSFQVNDESGGSGLLLRSRLSLPFLIVERDLLEDVKVFIDPALLVFVPPRLVVVERDAKPSLQRFFKALVTSSFVSPAEDLNQLVATEVDFAFSEAILLGELNESENDFVIERGRKPVLVGG